MKNFTPGEIAESLDRMFTEITPEEIKTQNRQAMLQSETQFKLFKSHFENANCYLCFNPLDSVKEDIPCTHWLLRKNKRFKKNKHFPGVFKKFDMFQIQAYLRWCANLEKPFQKY